MNFKKVEMIIKVVIYFTIFLLGFVEIANIYKLFDHKLGTLVDSVAEFKIYAISIILLLSGCNLLYVLKKWYHQEFRI